MLPHFIAKPLAATKIINTMKQHLKLLLFITGIIYLSSCTSTRQMTSSIKPNEIMDLQLIEPYSYISLIESRNKAKYNDTISKKSKKLISKVLNSLQGQIPLKGEISFTDTTLNRRIKEEIEFLCLSAHIKKNISNLEITPVIDSLLEINGKRFGLLTLASGFKRDKGNYGGQVAKGIGLGILTLGMYYQVPIKSNSTVHAMIVDSEANNIAFYRSSFVQDKDPLDEKVILRQFHKIFEGYFQMKN